MGRSKLLSGGLRVDKDEAKQLVSEFVQAVETASETRTGMLLIIEREAALTDIADTGTVIDAAISAELIGNIFYEGSPLHDGAVIVRGDRLIIGVRSFLRCICLFRESIILRMLWRL